MLRKIAKVRAERAARQHAFKNMLTNLVSEGDREMRASTATATVVRRLQRCHYLRTRTPAARKAFGGALRRLVAHGDKSIKAENNKKRK